MEAPIVTLDTLPPELLLTIASFLCLADVLTTTKLCKRYRDLIGSDQVGWHERCLALWADKVYVPQGLQILAGGFDEVKRWEAQCKDELAAKGVKQIKKDCLGYGVKVCISRADHESISSN